jgi:TIR domain
MEERMEQSFRAFISYRRHDSFIKAGPDSVPDLQVIRNVEAALRDVGFTEVFVDTNPHSIEAGDNFEARIYQAIADCDLFVPLIGPKWLEAIGEKSSKGDPDIVVREIRGAINEEKEIVPILVDGAEMPPPRSLPRDIRSLYYKNGIEIKSADTVKDIAAKLRSTPRRVNRVGRLGPVWKYGYIVAALIAYYFCAIHPHIVGISEFGVKPWLGMAQVWSGFYIWPVFFLPFILVALYRPLTVLTELTLNASSPTDVLSYGSPLIFGTLVAILATLIEVISPDQVPWSIHPLLPQPGCVRGPATAGPELADLSSYDRNGQLLAQQGSLFWLRDKCWPNVFFYLTVPAYRQIAGQGYEAERPRVQRSFVAVLRSTFDVPYSRSFVAYVISFSILIWLAAVGITMAVFYVTVRIRRPDNTVLKIPSEDAYLCLTYAFVIFMVWVPFRMNTIYFKDLYYCADLRQCSLSADHYLYDIILGIMLLMAYLYLTVGLLIQYRRTALSLLGTAFILLITVSAFAVARFAANVAQLAELWQFYIAIAIPTIVIFSALWWQFDPSFVRLKDFRRTVEYETSEEGEALEKDVERRRANVQSAWANGLFYLLAFIVVAAIVGFLAQVVPAYLLAVIACGAILLLPLIGALQLREDEKLSDKSFLELSKLALSRLPLLGNAVGRAARKV